MELEIRSPNPPEVRAEVKIIRKGEKYESTFKPFGIEGSNSAKLEVSALPSINLEKRMEYLLDYPYGCSEQITSAAFPQLWLNELTSNDAAVAKTTSANIITGNQYADLKTDDQWRDSSYGLVLHSLITG